MKGELKLQKTWRLGRQIGGGGFGRVYEAEVDGIAAAAKFVAEDVSADSAAICSYVCASVYDGLEVIARGIQTEDSTSLSKSFIRNYTTQ